MADHLSYHVINVDAVSEIMHVAELFITYPHRVFPVRKGERVAGLVRRSSTWV